jgi:hypothetical protein
MLQELLQQVSRIILIQSLITHKSSQDENTYAYMLLIFIGNYHRYGRIDVLYAADIPGHILSQSLLSKRIDPYYDVINATGSVYIAN